MTTSTFRKSGIFKLPRIRTKDELFKTSPEIAHFFGGSPIGDGTSYSIPAARDTPSRPKGTESPRLFEEDSAEDTTMLLELEEVKKERQILMQSLAQCKTSGITAGGEAQDNNIRQLMKELKLKKEKLNELRQQANQKEMDLTHLMNTSTDCEKLMLSDQAYLLQYIEQLNGEMHLVKEDLIEVEAKNRLYTLLGERTRQEHMTSEQRVRESREMRKNCRDDVCALSRSYHETCSLKEETDKQLTKYKKIYREIQKDWQRKLKDRRKEVRSIRRSQAKEKEREQRRLHRRQEKEEAEMERKTKRDLEQKSMAEKVKALVPKIETMEAMWSRLCSVSRASSCDEIIAFWRTLKEKESAMQDVVDRKQTQELQAREELEELEMRRVHLLETQVGTEATPIDTNTPSIEECVETEKENNTSEQCHLDALTIRIEQGLRTLLIKTGSSTEDPASLPMLFDAVANRLEQISKTPSTGHLHHQAFPADSPRTVPLLEDEKPPQNRKVHRSYASSFKRVASTKQDSIAVDVTKLAGYIDEEQDALHRKRASAEAQEESQGGEQGITERSFLKARSMRFTMRQSRQRQA